MSFLDRLRKMLSGPPHIQSGAAEEASLHEEFGGDDAGEADLRRAGTLSGGAVVPGYATAEAVEAAEADLETEEAPPDPDP